ncbi:mannose-1-phosphate guanylyltransferase [Thermoproteota archaeon]
MAGGKGTRFWPLSRADKAKQFIPITGTSSLLEQTIKRLPHSILKDNIWILGNLEQAGFLSDLTLDIPQKQILYEPLSRNTAACIGWAAITLIEKDPDAIMVVLPSDHIIKEKKNFQSLIDHGVEFIKENPEVLLTFGITPQSAHTGYGYIEVGETMFSTPTPIYSVKQFHEKPDQKTAESYAKKARYFWNSGMFIWKADTILSLMKHHMPLHFSILEKIKCIQKGSLYQKELAFLYKKFESISIDYGILEKVSPQIRMISADITWSDLGSWSSLKDFWENDPLKNAKSPLLKKQRILALNSGSNIVHADKLVALIDVENLVIVDTEDALLIMPKKSDQNVKELYDSLPDEFK